MYKPLIRSESELWQRETSAFVNSKHSTSQLAIWALLVDRDGYDWIHNVTGETHHSDSTISYSPESAREFYRKLWRESKEELRYSAAGVLAAYGVTVATVRRLDEV
jgi:hypothetical protein